MLLRCRRLIELLGRSGLISEQEGFPLVGGDSRLRPFYPTEHDAFIQDARRNDREERGLESFKDHELVRTIVSLI